MRGLLFGLLWFFVSAGVILAGVATVHFDLNPPTKPEEADQEKVLISAAQLPNAPDLAANAVGEAEEADARVILVQNFIERHDSPLAEELNFGQVLVDLADTYEVDFRLLPAIAMQESNLCKVTPRGSYNCLGLGVHERGTWEFQSYQENFEAAAKILKTNYIDRGLTSPVEIMAKYTPKSNGSWAESVNQWMAEMRYDDRQAGRELKTNADLLEFVDNQAETESSGN
ncbi:MAG: hypothetical protein COY81_00650 [Candidatus Pacebacteria bacterium CG_4_10_14_0_8_um_filter_43_12]|nr:MAG: hypothetical protein COU66_02625 [Candidatus Pacebacteria bacterium CG10_big_fil_rev_8_21_14_0_10_44_11]PIY79836.1 MAG: hypothetical protein COY81_00650 [Candidatus Pacebacteria bacterium CG_4_10_14_0_8_um_filter_43_12]